MPRPSRPRPTSGNSQVISDLLQKGLALHQSGRGTEAAPVYERVLALDPKQPAANHLLGLVRLSEGRAADAVSLIARAIKGNPSDPQYHCNLGVALNAAGQPEEAILALDQAIALKPGYAEAYSNKGMALRSLKRLSEAADVYRQAIRLRPSEAGFHFNLANTLRDAGHLFDTESAYRRAVHLRPRYAAAINGLATALDHEGRAAEVLELLDKALEEMPSEATLHVRRGRTLYSMGRLTDAAAAFRRAIELDPGFGEAHLHLSYMQRHETRDAELEAAARLFEAADASDEARVFAGYAVGKALTDLDDHNGAIAAYKAANALNRRSISFSLERAVSDLERDTQRFEGVSTAQSEGGFRDAAPIFVLGLPRSGKTTVELVLARHPEVEGVGELPTLGRLVAELKSEIGDTPIADVPADRFTELGRAYMREAQSLATAGMRVVDTRPANYRHIGFIRLALPNARIIAPRRAAAEHIVAMYEKYFTAIGYEWSNDIDDIVAYRNAFEAQLTAWQRLFPGLVHEIDLVQLRQDRRAGVERLLDHCGLGWSDACLDDTRSEPQLGDWPPDRAERNHLAHLAAWRTTRPDLWR
jgi:tetratricopeptide (TPR) repeat protein